jgi:hypothetical protein
MILVADNTPYHHKQEIGSLQAVTKKKLLDMMVKYEVDAVDLPVTTLWFDLCEELEETGVEDRGKIIRIDFEYQEQEQCAGANKPRVGTLRGAQDLRHYLAEGEQAQSLGTPNWNGILQIGITRFCGCCHIVQTCSQLNYSGLLEKPRCKTFCRWNKKKYMVRHLCNGWYGNVNMFQEGDDKFHAVTDCKKLIQHAIGCAYATFIPLLDGISGMIGALTIDANYKRDTTSIPIDTLMVNLTNQVDDDEDISVTDSTAQFLCSLKSRR